MHRRALRLPPCVPASPGQAGQLVSCSRSQCWAASRTSAAGSSSAWRMPLACRRESSPTRPVWVRSTAIGSAPTRWCPGRCLRRWRNRRSGARGRWRAGPRGSHASRRVRCGSAVIRRSVGSPLPGYAGHDLAAVKRLEKLGDNLPPTECELLVILVLRVFDPGEPHAPAMPTLRSARRPDRHAVTWVTAGHGVPGCLVCCW
jgi:hypothetical protein